MNDFHFQVDAYIDHVTSLAGDIVEDWDINVIDFDEFDSGEDTLPANIMKNRIKRKEIKDLIRMYAIETMRDFKVKKCDNKRVRAYCYGLVVVYGKGKHADVDDSSKHTKCVKNPYASSPYTSQKLGRKYLGVSKH
ncbi:hypothetical protein Tco_0654706 [Tanacetum coccineum]|uniref:Transposase n=1 Tax=Tanacetum coccineum TaxID=301880 RepID=A0ABQ4X484_9ASTR